MANEEILEEEEFSVLPLEDENGETTYFGYLDTVELNGTEYLVMVPVILDEAGENVIEESDETVVFEVIPVDEENEDYVAVSDEGILETVFAIFKEHNNDKYTFED